MNRLLKFILVLLAFVSLCSGDASSTSPADELSKEDIYNINADIYCITDLVIKEKLLDIEDPVNTYTEILGDDIKDIDCEAVLKEYVARVHKRLRKDFKKKGADIKTLNCFMTRIEALGYDKMRFKFNALYGIEVEKEKKDKLRSDIDTEIGNLMEQSVDECWMKEKAAKNATESGENTNSL